MKKEKKKSEAPKQKVEESKEEKNFFATLTYAPSKYLTALNHIALRLARSVEDAETQSAKNYLETTQKLVCEFANRLNKDYEPQPPKTLEDAYNYALSRPYEGTFLALLDVDNHLVKTVILSKKRLGNLPEYTITSRTVEMKMEARFISIPDLSIERPIPKRAVKVVPFSSDKNQVFSYKAPEK